MAQIIKQYIRGCSFWILFLALAVNSIGESCSDLIASTVAEGESSSNIHILDICNRREYSVTTDGVSWGPKWSPMGDLIAYQRITDFMVQIHVKDLGDGNTREISGDFLDARYLDWSPDGENISFAGSLDGNNAQIYLVDRQGLHLRQFVASDGNATYSAWSPNGEYVAFVSHLAESQHKIYITDAEGSYLRTLYYSEHAGLIDDYLAWSPDNSQLLFIKAGSGGQQIYSIKLDGSEVKQLTNEGYNYVPDWSPKGDRITFEGHRDDPDIYVSSEIFVMDPDGTNLVQLTSSGWNSSPVWSPDGELIAFASSQEGNIEIYIMEANGSNQERISELRNSNYQDPVWMPSPVP